MTVTAAEQLAIRAPASFDLDRFLATLNGPSLTYSSHYRRIICRTSPLTFALLYFGDRHLVSPETGPDINLSQFHLDITRAAERWMRNDLGLGELREAWIAPRGSGKSTMAFVILACWALAFGHRRFIAAFTANNSRAVEHLGNLRREFAENKLLRLDFPELVTPARTAGANTQNKYVAKSGATVQAFGIDSSTLGTKHGNRRPDLLLFDDIEPDDGNYSPYQKDQRLSTVINGVLAMNPNAVVQWCGTVTMFGSATHDLVRWALGERNKSNAWVGEQNFRCRYYAPLITDPNGAEESFWPARYPTEYLQRMRGTTYYALNFENHPRSTTDGLWRPGDLVIRDRAATEYVLRVDPAVTAKATSDLTGLAVVGLCGRDVSVVDAFGIRGKYEEIVRLVHQMAWENRALSVVEVETNQGGDALADSIEPVLPPGVKLERVHTREAKGPRFHRLFDYHLYGWVSYAEEFPELFKQMLGWPKIRNDDIVDALAGACDHWLKDRPRPKAR